VVRLGREGGAELDADIERDAPDAPTVRLSGELDLSNVDALAALIDPIIDAGPECVIFVIEDLGFMDSSGIALLLRCAARVGTVVVRRPSRIVRRVLETTGVSQVLKIEP
jgi:anti-anti-sigma factor